MAARLLSPAAGLDARCLPEGRQSHDLGVINTMWWDPYNLFRGQQVEGFWASHLGGGGRKLLFIVGAGFDPRVLGPLRTIIGADPSVDRKCLAIDMSEGYATDEAANALGQQNRRELAALFPGGQLELRKLVPTDTDGI